MTAIGALQDALALQVLVSTHSPLVLSSMEPIFDEAKDRLFELSVDKQSKMVGISAPPWTKRGDVVAWLVSDTFGLQQARSVPAEEAIEAAERFMRGETDKEPRAPPHQGADPRRADARPWRPRPVLAALDRLYAEGARAMIRVEQVDEPASFDGECRQPGKKWLAEHPAGDPHTYPLWNGFRCELRAVFHGRCGFLEHWILTLLPTSV